MSDIITITEQLIEAKKIEVQALELLLQSLLPPDNNVIFNHETESFKTEKDYEKFTLEQVIDASALTGVSKTEAEAFYHHYNSQGWFTGTGREITNLRSALMKWKNNIKVDKKSGPSVSDLIASLPPQKAK